MDVILSNGDQARFGPLDGGQLEAKMRLEGLEGDIYRKLLAIGETHRDEILARYPRIQRRVSGYNLDEFVGGSAFNMARFAVGSEGTLVTIAEAKVKIVQRPKFRGLGVLHFTDLIESMEATVATLELEPAAVEHIGSMILRQARDNLVYSRLMDFIEGDPESILVVEFVGDTESEVSARLDLLEARMRRGGMGYAMRRLMSPAEQAKVWEVRKAGLGLMMNVPGSAKPLPFVEDTAVAPDVLPEFVRRFDEIVKEHGTTAGYYGHASVGCLHIRPLIDLKRQDGVERMVSIAEEISDLVLEYGGSMSGEHGDGLVRSGFNEKMFGSTLYGAFREVKAAFDPNGIMNPGKIVDSPPMTESLRIGPAYTALTPATGFNYSVGGQLRERDRDVQRPGRVPKGAWRHHVPLVHGHARRGALDARQGERAARRDVGGAAARGDDRRAYARGDGALPGVQGLQGRVPLQRGHGQAQVRVPGQVPRGQRPLAARTSYSATSPAGARWGRSSPRYRTCRSGRGSCATC